MCITCDVYSGHPVQISAGTWDSTVFRGFPQSLQTSIIPQLGHKCYSSSYLLFTNYPTIWHYTIELVAVLLNKMKIQVEDMYFYFSTIYYVKAPYKHSFIVFRLQHHISVPLSPQKENHIFKFLNVKTKVQGIGSNIFPCSIY